MALMQGLMQRNNYILHDTDMIINEGNDRYILKVRDLPTDARPREKMLAAGCDMLTYAELMAVILGVGTRKEEVLTMSHRIMREYGEQTVASECDPRKLAAVLDIPIGHACQIIASFELGRRAFQTRGGRPLFVHTASQAYEHFNTMAHLQKEQLRGLYLNSRFQVVHEEIIAIGSLTANIVHPREVFKPAIENGAVAVIIAHNHPSGSLEPTTDDQFATRQLIEAGEVLGIELLDHLIITSDGYNSCRGEINDGQ